MRNLIAVTARNNEYPQRYVEAMSCFNQFEGILADVKVFFGNVSAGHTRNQALKYAYDNNYDTIMFVDDDDVVAINTATWYKSYTLLDRYPDQKLGVLMYPTHAHPEQGVGAFTDVARGIIYRLKDIEGTWFDEELRVGEDNLFQHELISKGMKFVGGYGAYMYQVWNGGLFTKERSQAQLELLQSKMKKKGLK